MLCQRVDYACEGGFNSCAQIVMRTCALFREVDASAALRAACLGELIRSSFVACSCSTGVLLEGVRCSGAVLVLPAGSAW